MNSNRRVQVVASCGTWLQARVACTRKTFLFLKPGTLILFTVWIQMVHPQLAQAALADKYEKSVADAVTSLNRGEYAKAAKTAGEAAASNQNRYQAFLTAAKAFRLEALFAELEDKARLAGQASENLKRAVSILKQINITAPSTKDLDYATHLDAAWKADADNLVAKAALEYEAAFLTHPGDANAAFGAMVAFKRTLDYGKAEKYARVLLSAQDKKLVQQAKLELPKLREVPPQVTDALTAVRGLVDQGKLEEAEAKARENLAKMPFLGELHFWVGFALARRGEIQPSIASFRESVRQGFNSEPDFVRAAEIPAILRNDGFLTLVTDGIGDSCRKSVLDLWEKKESQIRRETRAKFDGFMAAAHEAAGRRDFTNARAEALKAKSLIPDEPTVISLLEDISKAEISMHLEAAREALARKDFSSAKTEALKAKSIDGQAVAKLLEEIEQAEFSSHLTSSQDALTRKDIAIAKAEALKAKSLRQNDAEVQRLLQEIEIAEKLLRVAGFLKEARGALGQKQFEIAFRKAKEALDIDRENGEAKALLAEIGQAIVQDKRERAEKMIAQARLVYRKDRSGALAALEQALVLSPGNAAALSLKGQVIAFWEHVDELRAKLNGINPQKPRISLLEAIAELRMLFPENTETQRLWDRHCSFTNSLGIRFLFIAKPQLNIEVGDNSVPRGVFIAQFETTECQWENIMGAGNSLYTESKVWNPDGTYYQPGMDHPVCQITVLEASAFCDKLSAKEGKRYRLPTEREWEYACTAGEPTIRFSNASLTNQAWFYFNCHRDGQNYPHTVGQKQPNAFGLYDMIGNVAEWCVPASAGTNLAEVAVLKGGSWKDPVEMCDPKAQQRIATTQREKWAGIRIVYEPEE